MKQRLGQALEAWLAERGVAIAPCANGWRWEEEAEQAHGLACRSRLAACLAALDAWEHALLAEALAEYHALLDGMHAGGLAIGPADDERVETSWGWEWTPTGCNGGGCATEAEAVERALIHLAGHDGKRQEPQQPRVRQAMSA